ncbi:hypothetical protein ATCC90586_003651 [Pythium insidiosum]|nr:hypothetical protein ATCC90586_003651 [Pythium insidiosum]
MEAVEPEQSASVSASVDIVTPPPATDDVTIRDAPPPTPTMPDVATGADVAATPSSTADVSASDTSSPLSTEFDASTRVPDSTPTEAEPIVNGNDAAPSSASAPAPPTAAPATRTVPVVLAAAGSTMPPKPRKSSGGNARRVRTGSGHVTTTAAAPTTAAAVVNGIFADGVRRRNRGGRSFHRQNSGGSSGEDVEVVDGTPAGSATPKLKKAIRSVSFKNAAIAVRSNIRSSITIAGNGAANDNSEAANSSQATQSFAGVAQQVVSTQRAAKGFLSMWSHGSNITELVYKGIHMEKKKLDLKTVMAEFKEIKRRQFYQELVVYLVFLMLFFSLLGWLPVKESYQQNDVVGSLTCREEGVCELKKFADVYEFAGGMAERICDRKGVNAQWHRIGGVRFRQVRVKEEQCKVYNGWFVPCYPFYSPDAELKEPIQGAATKREYAWNAGLGPLRPQLSTSLTEWGTSSNSVNGMEHFGHGGYAVDLCDVSADELQEDDWLSVSTRAFSIEFILINPVTRVFTIGWHVFTMSPSGHMKHYPHSAHLRVIGLEDAELVDGPSTANLTSPLVHRSAPGSAHLGGRVWTLFRDEVVGRVWATMNALDSRIFIWLGLVLFFVTYTVGEVTEMMNMGAGTYLKSDMWNVFEMAHLLMLASLLAYCARYYVACWRFGDHLNGVMAGKSVEEIDHGDVQELLGSFQQLSDAASLASAISLLKVFKFLRMNSTLNLLWRVLGMATRDLMGFLVIFNLIFLGYSAMGSYAFGFALEEFSTIGKSYATCFHMLAGEMDYPRLRQANPRLAPWFIGTFVVLVFQILVNMFVAILSEYYESAKNDEGSGDDVEYDVLERVRSYLKACSPTVVVKKNEVIRLIPKQQVRLISTNLVDKEETRQRAKKLFRGVVWRVVALLRFGMKFDRRIQFGDRKTTAQTASGHNGKDAGMVSHICLSENFDHKTIKEMIPIGITIRLQGDSLLGDGVALKVLRHNKLSVECVVLGQCDHAGNMVLESVHENPLAPPTSRGGVDRELELLGGEKLRFPWQVFAFHVFRTMLKELRDSLMRATKLWNYSKSKAHLVNDYHLLLLFESMKEEGRASLRYDEVYRMLDLYVRKDKKRSQCTQEEVKQETLQVMFRFRKCLIDMPSREKEGHNYRPKPVDTSSIELGQLEHLADMLAQNCHDMWALERLKQGWQYGPQRDDATKKHPNLVPYHLLSWDEQQYDYRSSVETLKTIVFMNYTILRHNPSSGSFHESLSRSSSNVSDENDPVLDGDANGGASESVSTPKKKPVPHLLREAMSFRRNSLMEDSPYFTKYGENLDLVYRPLPIDTSKVELPPRLLRLVDLLSENAHEVWAKGRMDEGWTYGPARDDSTKKHPCLVPYIFLTDDEKEYDINIAKETLKTLLAMKFTLTDRSMR